MPQTTKRQQLIEAVESRMQTILKANDYSTDLGLYVRVSPTKQSPDSDPLALDLFFPGSGSDISEATKRWDHTLDVDLDVGAIGQVTEADLSNMMADVFAAIGTDPGWSGLAVRTIPPQINPEWERKGRLIGGANITFKIEYMTPAWKI